MPDAMDIALRNLTARWRQKNGVDAIEKEMKRIDEAMEEANQLGQMLMQAVG